jgi:hypothetical protein
MTRFIPLSIIIFLTILPLSALQLVDSNGLQREFDNALLHKHPTQEIKTSREKDGVVRLNNWDGFRCDIWLKEQNPGNYNNIRFESSDHYQVNLSKSEFESLESYLVIAQDGVPFENNALRLIFPTLREMQWIRDLQRIVLEDFKPLPRPRRFYLMESFLAKQALIHEPKPFVKIDGWLFSDLLQPLSDLPEKQVILFSRDGLKQSLRYPYHLDGAVLEKAAEGYNLKSPQIPGGMWVKDIVYLQCDSGALIARDSLSRLIELARLLSWETSPELSFRIVHPAGEEVVPFSDALAEPQMFEGALYFELF